MRSEVTAFEQRGGKMAFDKAKYNQEWKDANRDRIMIRVPKGAKTKLDEAASRQGKQMGRFIKDALYYYMDALGVERINLE